MSLEQLLDQPALRVLDAVPIALSASAPDSRLVYGNPALRRALALPPERLMGLHLADALPPAERSRVQDAWLEWQRQEPRGLRVSLRGPEGELQPYLLLPGPLSTPGGSLLGIVVGWVPAASPAGSEALELRATLRGVGAALENALSLSRALDGSAPRAGIPGLAQLTERERGVMTRLVRGDRVAHISAEFRIQPVTVRNHLKAIFRKLGVHSQRELVAHVRGAARSSG